MSVQSAILSGDLDLPASKRLILFAVLCLAYHGQVAFGQVASGCNDQTWFYEICWEYDLEHSTGRVSIESIGGYFLAYKFENILPSDATLTSVTGDVFGWGDMDKDLCSGMTAVIPGEPIAVLDTNKPAEIEFTFPTTYVAVDDQLTGEHVRSAINCLPGTIYTSPLTNFVSVAPMKCPFPDTDDDGDIDLADFKNAQNTQDLDDLYACFDQFVRNFGGPTLSA